MNDALPRTKYGVSQKGRLVFQPQFCGEYILILVLGRENQIMDQDFLRNREQHHPLMGWRQVSHHRSWFWFVRIRRLLDGKHPASPLISWIVDFWYHQKTLDSPEVATHFCWCIQDEHRSAGISPKLDFNKRPYSDYTTKSAYLHFCWLELGC